VLLTGHDGDTIVSHGQDYPNELVELGEWSRLKGIVETRVKNRKNESDTSLEKEIEWELYQYVLPYLKELVKNLKVKSYIKVLYQISQDWSFPPRRILGLIKRSMFQKRQRVEWQSYNANINADLACQIDLGQLLQDEFDYQFAYLQSEYFNHYRGITSGNLLASTEQIDGVNAALAIEPRHPFLDKRLIELCSAVPAHLKFCNGFGRGVMRRAMKDILPEEVRCRGSKVDFYGFIIPAMETDERELIEELLEGQSELSRYVDSHALYQEYREFSNSTTPWQQRRRRARMIACVSFLSIWLS